MATTQTHAETTTASCAEIEIAPNPSFIDEDVSIRVSGVPSGARVTLRAEVNDDAGRVWEASGTYVADAAGTVDVASQESLGGTYRGRDGMGLFWSMKLEAAARGGRATFRKDSPAAATVALTAEIAGQITASGKLDRRWLAPGMQVRDASEDANEEGLAGRLFIPPGREPHPVVIVLGGSGGGYDLDKAAVLARHGFATLSLAYFGLPGLPTWLHRVPLEYFARATAWLENQPEVDARRMGVLGISRGAELALLLSSTLPEIRAERRGVGLRRPRQSHRRNHSVLDARPRSHTVRAAATARIHGAVGSACGAPAPTRQIS